MKDDDNNTLSRREDADAAVFIPGAASSAAEHTENASVVRSMDEKWRGLKRCLGEQSNCSSPKLED